MKKACVLLSLLVLSVAAFCQNDDVDRDEYDENFEFRDSRSVNVSVGLGLGLDYGGIGGKLMFVPTGHIGIFAAIGYNLNGAGYNGGLTFRILPDKKVCPYITGMYGYNAVIIVDGLDSANKTYYGPSFGGGIELRRKSGNFWNFEMLFPVRSSDYKNDIDALKRRPDIEMTDALPVQISIGYHFAL